MPTVAAPTAPPDGDATDGLDVLLQRATAALPPPAKADPPGIANSRVDSPEPPAPVPPDSPRDTAEIADAVYDRIERRLRYELLGELERRGTLTGWG